MNEELNDVVEKLKANDNIETGEDGGGSMVHLIAAQ